MRDPKLLSLKEDIKRAMQASDDDFEENQNGLVLLAPAPYLLDITKILRDESVFDFNQLMDLCGADYPDRAKRFDVVYQFLSTTTNRRLTIKVAVDEKSPVPSLSHLYSVAGWFEREAFDMFGILFSDHPDLRRILTEDDFEGHPLRKDFPVCGFTEIRYDETQKAIVREPVEIPQAYRDYDNVSPWTAMPVTTAREVK